MKKSAKSPAQAARAGATHHPHMRHAIRSHAPAETPMFEVRSSGIHGRGAYATRKIPKGMRVVEYLGDRITHEQADARYEEKGQDDGHTFLFVVSSRVVIDAGVQGNEARFINHSCDPNCDTVIEGERVFIESVRDIEPGEELAYEYGLTWETTDDSEELANYACRCGAASCRGTMLAEEPLDMKKVRKRKAGNKGKGKAKSKGKGKDQGKAKVKAKAKVKVEARTRAKAKAKTKAKNRPGRNVAGKAGTRRNPATRGASRAKKKPGKSQRR
jgi:uncharacterized protein